MEVQNNWIWDILRIEATTDKREIKKAYAHLSKKVHPEEKPEEFQRLYEAYQKALQYASSEKRTEGYIVNVEKDREGDIDPEKEEAPEEQERDKYKELGLEGGGCQVHRYNEMEEIARFQNWWQRHMPMWLEEEPDLGGESTAYLRSERFREIMWSPAVLKIIAEGVGRYFLKKEQVLLFFWDLYDFGKAAEADHKDESLLLYRKLYPAYTNRVKRQQYAENKDKIQNDERRHMQKVAIIGVCVMVGIIPAIFVLAQFKVLEVVLVIVCAVVVLRALFLLLGEVMRL